MSTSDSESWPVDWPADLRRQVHEVFPSGENPWMPELLKNGAPALMRVLEVEYRLAVQRVLDSSNFSIHAVIRAGEHLRRVSDLHRIALVVYAQERPNIAE